MIKVNGIDMTEYVLTQKLSDYATQEDLFLLAVLYMEGEASETFRDPATGALDFTFNDLLKNTTNTDFVTSIDDILARFASNLGVFDPDDRAQFILGANIHFREMVTGKKIEKPETWVDAVEKASNEVTAPVVPEFLPNQWYEAAQNTPDETEPDEDEDTVTLRVPEDFSEDENDLILRLFELIGCIRLRKESPMDAILASNDFFKALMEYEHSYGLTAENLDKVSDILETIANA